MITLKYASGDAALNRVEEKLRSLSLAFQKEENDSPEIRLEDSSRSIEGEAAILAYLEELEQELGQWYYCSC